MAEMPESIPVTDFRQDQGWQPAPYSRRGAAT
jgi:hypothetical protein